MRRPEFRMPRNEALALLARARVIHLAGTHSEGAPLARTLNAVVVQDWLLFHGSRIGEKLGCVGRPVVIGAEEVVAQIPSYFVDPSLACPATTFYRSVQVHGVLERIDDLDLKAAMLAAMMRKYQPEGGYLPIDRHAPAYARVIQGIFIAGVRLAQVTGKRKLGQNRRPHEIAAIVQGLWRRGAPGDAEALEAVLEANPQVPLPALLQGPGGTRLLASCPPEDAPSAARLVEGHYWRRDSSRDAIQAAMLASTAWVGARAPDGTLIATARAVSDTVWSATISDVAVAEAWRGRGIGTAVMRLLLDHPQVRHAAFVRLGTADAQRFYASLGFEEASRVDLGFHATAMVRRQPVASRS